MSPGMSGKSALFPVHSFEIDHFNADDRSAQLNGGSYQGISLQIRAARVLSFTYCTSR